MASAWVMRGNGIGMSTPAAANGLPQDALDQVLELGRLDERGLDVELGELGLAVGAQVLVAEAADDLVVALEAADHQELLEELGALGQRVPGAALQAARHQEVARALGRRAGEHRRLDLEEALGVEHARASRAATRARISSARSRRGRRMSR